MTRPHWSGGVLAPEPELGTKNRGPWMGKVCRKCGYERQLSDYAPDYECPKCGAVYAKVEASLKRQQKEAQKCEAEIEAERRKKREEQPRVKDGEAEGKRKESDVSGTMTSADYLARAGKSFAKGIGVIFVAMLALFALIWISGTETGGGAVKSLIALMILIPIYFLPSFAAKSRKHSKRQAIFVLNLLLGWTFIGWVAAAVWAYTENNATT